MQTQVMCPRIEELELLPAEQLAHYATVAELAIAKPYFLDRIKLALFLKEAR